MASPVSGNAFQTYQAGGSEGIGLANNEDLEDVFYRISPTETPFLTMAKRVTVSAARHDWVVDELASAGQNKQIEGDDAANGTSNPVLRFANMVQSSSKYAVVTDNQNAVMSVNRAGTMANQIAKRTAELKRDMEAIALSGQGCTIGSAAVAAGMAGVQAWLTANSGNSASLTGNSISCGLTAEGTTPGAVSGTTAFNGVTDASTAGTFGAANLKYVIKQCWDAGGNPGIILCNSSVKQRISAFAGIATLYREAGATAKGTQIIGAADLYVSDFGEHRVVPDRFVNTIANGGGGGLRGSTALILDMDYWGVGYLRKVSQKEIARTGSSEKRFIDVAWTIVAHQPASSGKATDINPLLTGNA